MTPPGWAKIENDAVDRLSALGPVEIAVYVALLRHAERDARTCYPSLRRIGEVAGVSERRARMAVRNLVAAGLVERQERVGPTGVTISALYHLPLLTPQDQAEQNGRVGGTKRQGEGEQNDRGTRGNRTREMHATLRFTPPTLQEVQVYCSERKNQVDPQRFLDHYESNGWRVGRNAMKDWRAAVRTWERNGYHEGNGKINGKPAEAIKYRDEVRR